MAFQASPGLLRGNHADRGFSRGRFVCEVPPGNVAQSAGRTGFDTFRVAIAGKTLCSLSAFVIETDHVTGTGSQAKATANTGSSIYKPGARHRVCLDGVFGTGRGARYGMRTLKASVHHELAVSPCAKHSVSTRGSFRAEAEIPAGLNSSKGGLSPSVVEFGTRQFTAQTADATG